MTTLGIRKDTLLSYDEALAKVPDALKTEGFGVLTEVDVRDTLHKKLGVEFRRYKILGACNPPLAYQALSTQLEAGLMMPCNVIVYEGDDGKAVVTAIDPVQTIAAQGSPALRKVAETVREKLSRSLERLV